MILDIDSLTISYDKEVVRGFSLNVEDSSFVTVLGPSGCGKSTLLGGLAGIVPADSGRIVLNDRVLYDSRSGVCLPPEKRGVAMVFQTYALWPHMSVKQHLMFPLKMRRVKKAEAEELCSRMARMLNLSGKLERNPLQLSGGEQQRVALGRSLITSPDLLLLDEPFSNLDAVLRERMQDEILQIHEAVGVTTVMVTHDQREAEKMSDRVVVMNEGIIEQEGTLDAIRRAPATEFVKQFIR